MSTKKKRLHTYDDKWVRTYARLIDSTLLDYPEAKKKCFYCGTTHDPDHPTSTTYVVEVVVDHLAALDFRTELPIQSSIDHIHKVIKDQGVKSITKARHLVTTCPGCHVKLISIGWTK
jgi:5-methylcytosine-specific restriction endonuclease McrA